jgi:hypothetical protein
MGIRGPRLSGTTLAAGTPPQRQPEPPADGPRAARPGTGALTAPAATVSLYYTLPKYNSFYINYIFIK